jgi:pheromone shutdown protein TraB
MTILNEDYVRRIIDTYGEKIIAQNEVDAVGVEKIEGQFSILIAYHDKKPDLKGILKDGKLEGVPVIFEKSERGVDAL